MFILILLFSKETLLHILLSPHQKIVNHFPSPTAFFPIIYEKTSVIINIDTLSIAYWSTTWRLGQIFILGHLLTLCSHFVNLNPLTIYNHKSGKMPIILHCFLTKYQWQSVALCAILGDIHKHLKKGGGWCKNITQIFEYHKHTP